MVAKWFCKVFQALECGVLMSSQPVSKRKLYLTDLQRAKQLGEPFATLTAYDYSTARLLDDAGIPLLLVGDSLAMTVLGYPDTLSVTMEEMLHHTKAVARAAQQAVVVGDMPFMSYHLNEEQGIANAGRFLQEGRADAVKLEGASPQVLRLIQRLTGLGIPVVAHVGLTPQQVKALGGFRLQGKTVQQAQGVLQAAIALEEAGAQALVLEMIPAEVAATITQRLTIPTIGIGAGPSCDGHILVVDDLLARYEGKPARFVRSFADVGQATRQAAEAFQQAVRTRNYPAAQESFFLPEGERQQWQQLTSSLPVSPVLRAGQ